MIKEFSSMTTEFIQDFDTYLTSEHKTLRFRESMRLLHCSMNVCVHVYTLIIKFRFAIDERASILNESLRQLERKENREREKEKK